MQGCSLHISVDDDQVPVVFYSNTINMAGKREPANDFYPQPRT